jgi:hypothetical protein
LTRNRPKKEGVKRGNQGWKFLKTLLGIDQTAEPEGDRRIKVEKEKKEEIN